IPSPSVEFQNLSFRYHQHGEAVLKKLNLRIEAGEKVGIIGSTGSGKSSFVQLIHRCYDATEGKLLLGGIDIKEISKESLMKEVAMVMQNPLLFSGSVEENLRYGDQTATEEKMMQTLEKAQALSFINEERTLLSRVEQRGKNFSGGQKQRLSIARALMKEPSILILDDASSALDMETEAQLMKGISKLEKKMTLILVAQRISSLMHMDKIIVMKEGEIEAVGRHEELLRVSPVYQSIAISQLGKELA
ncbi:MAG: ABC transporter ATP-binding protein, partial [Vallitaleaceae bacterium]|nr:ABC transporter ATP-binding protein [Vallitaleaceae bacterium]